jgi:hypothetical protein
MGSGAAAQGRRHRRRASYAAQPGFLENTIVILMSGDARRKLRHDCDQQPHRSSVVVLVLASLDIRRAILNIGQTAAMKPLLLALLLGLNLLGSPVMATEEPPFTVKSAHGEFEVRDYPALVAAEVTVKGDRKDAAGKGFRRNRPIVTAA